MLREFLNHVDADTIYLVGDIIDGERLKHQHYWPQEHEEVLDLLSKKAQAGTKVIYIAGNHDEGLRDWMHQEGIPRNNHKDELHYRHFTFKQADSFADAAGRRHLVIHGDQFDGLMQKGHALDWLLPVGDVLYDGLAWLNRHINHLGEKLHLPYWSLAGWVKGGVKTIVGALNRIEDKLADEVRSHSATGVIFGHTHIPLERAHNGVTLRNDGDWVDSISGFVESVDGQLKLLDWAPLYNQWKAAQRAGDIAPQRAFTVLASQYGANAQAGGPMVDFSQVARVSGNVPSRYAELLELATHGPQPQSAWPFPAGIRSSLPEP
jgi:UDP-2,3-diacylglucosamine pyrophosphatase LpxH